MSYPRIPLDLETIIARYNEGESSREIADTLPVSRETIARRLREAGVPLRLSGGQAPGKIPAKELPIQEVIDRYAVSKSLRAVGEYYSVAPRTLRALLVKAGVDIHPRPSAPGLPVDAIVSRYTDGESQYTIARDLQVDPTTIERRLRQAGVTLRPKRTARHRP